MMVRYWKIRKLPILLASIAGGATYNSLPSWEGDRAADENPGVATAPHSAPVKASIGQPDTTEQHANMNSTQALTRKVIGRYKKENQWLVLNP